MTKVREIMSFGVLTVNADDQLDSIIGRLRRIGHEGYPVIDSQGQLVGLLTARDMNRAAENELAHLPVSAVMMAGNIYASPDTSISDLIQLMTTSEWGQIPVVQNHALVGVVTRTDVIHHYAKNTATHTEHQITHSEIEAVLGKPVATLIAVIASHASTQNQTIYMVGGVVRDLLLQRPNLDIDFVIEGDAIAFAESLKNTFGGDIHTHATFGTATWHIDTTVAASIDYTTSELPAHLDLVTARHEFYEEPATLPTVYHSGIRLDLRRRDFTINALAVELNADGASGTVIDLFGGLDDLKQGIIRALHSLSFADDPTRTLRAVRFAHRLDFTIDARTVALIDTALPMMKRITGERLKNELTLLFKENNPEIALLRLQEMGVLQAIHPDFVVRSNVLRSVFETARTINAIRVENEALYHWSLVAAAMSVDAIEQIAERLLIGKRYVPVLTTVSAIYNNPELHLTGKTSDITFGLDSYPLDALQILEHFIQQSDYQKVIHNYLKSWRHVAPNTTGNTLQDMGVSPGPEYKTILTRLKAAYLDGEVRSSADEHAMLQQLIERLST